MKASRKSPIAEPLAELIGTFTLVFIGAGTGALAATHGGGIVAVALAHGLAVATSIYAWGAISGAHINPAVSFGLAVSGRMSWPSAAKYMGAQLLGGALAALLLKLLIGETGGLGQTVGNLTTAAPFKALIAEAVLTFFLVTAVFGSAVTGRNGNMVGLAIGLVVTMDILVGGALTGGSMNPARSFGPALAMGDFSYLWIYILGPFAGAAGAALLYNKLFTK